MKNKFKIGDDVYTKPVEDEWLDPENNPVYVDDMLEIQGSSGRIVDYDDDFDDDEFWMYEVVFEDGDSWWYREEWLGKREHINIDDLLEVTDSKKARKKKKVRVVGFKVDKKVIGIVKRKKVKSVKPKKYWIGIE